MQKERELFMECMQDPQSKALQHIAPAAMASVYDVASVGMVLALAAAFRLTVNPVVGYPGWQPDFDSPLLAMGKALHRELFGHEPAVKAIHAGLECGILKSKKPDVDILSFGPTIRGAHSPTERLEIATVTPFWQYLKALLADI